MDALSWLPMVFGYFCGFVVGYVGHFLDAKGRNLVSTRDLQAIQSVRIESERADVTHWRIIDRTTGADLTPSIHSVDLSLSPEEGIVARLHFKADRRVDDLLVQDSEIALTAMIDASPEKGEAREAETDA